MKNFLFTIISLSVSAAFLLGCNPAANNANRTTPKSNNTAVNSASNNSNGSPNSAKAPSETDKLFVDQALLSGLQEVQMSGEVTVHGDSHEVKSLAQTMINDHSRANSDIRDLAKRKNIELTGGTTPDQLKEQAELLKLSGKEFDREYVKKMAAIHEKDVAEFQREADTATDADIKKFAAETLPTLKKHLQTIQDLQAKIK